MPPADRPASAAAGFWPRAVAWTLDAAIVGTVSMAMAKALFGLSATDVAACWQALGRTTGETVRAAAERGDEPAALLRTLLAGDGAVRQAIEAVAAAVQATALPALGLFLALSALYWPWQEAGRHHATFGKRLLGLQVVADTGVALRGPQALMRHAAGALSWLTLNIGHVLAVRGPRHCALHDRLAHTQVRWREGASRRVPAWGWLLLISACLLPIVWSVFAAASLSAAMNAALLG